MKINTFKKYCKFNQICLSFAFIFLLSSFALNSGKIWAKNVVDIDRTCNLTVQVPQQSQELKNAELKVKLYRTADITKSWKYRAIGSYELMNNYEYSFINGNNVIEKIKVNLNEINSNTTAKQWEGLTFAAKKVAKSETPNAVETIADGKAVFQGLQPGLYLVEVDGVILNDRTYRFMSYLISLPNYNSENPVGEKTEYDVNTELKVEVKDNNTTTQVTTFKPTENETTTPKEKIIKTPKNQPDETSKYFGTLPQTGQLKWIIPVLFLVGFICIGIGVQLLKKENKSE